MILEIGAPGRDEMIPHIIRVVGVHLTSNHQRDAALKRVRQLTNVMEGMLGGHLPHENVTTLLMGDFNMFPDDLLTPKALPSTFLDCWLEVNTPFFYYFYTVIFFLSQFTL